MLATLGSDDAAAAAVRQSGPHVAVDMAGWTLGTRMGVFARRVAPLQLHYLGFIASTGARFVDGFVADPVSMAVEASRAEFQEPLVLLPRGTPFFAPGALHDRARQAAVSVTATARRATIRRHLARPGAAQSAFPRPPRRFLSPNSLYKLCPLLLSAWANLLRRLPGSTLAVIAVPADGVRNVRRELAARGACPPSLPPMHAAQPLTPPHPYGCIPRRVASAGGSVGARRPCATRPAAAAGGGPWPRRRALRRRRQRPRPSLRRCGDLGLQPCPCTLTRPSSPQASP